jgi:hypothetical protein
MNKQNMKLLGEISGCEVSVHLPYQSKNKQYKKLEEEGYCEFVARKIHFDDNLPPMTVSGWELTEKGRIEYCLNCSQSCLWSRADDDTDCWETSCDQAFSIIDGTPAENSMKFCTFCGKPVEEG